jgi:hypothetical protein
VSPDDGQVMTKHVETLNLNKAKVKVRCISSWLCSLPNYVTMTHGQQNFKLENSFSGDGNFKIKRDLSQSTSHTPQKQTNPFAKPDARFNLPSKVKEIILF